MHRSALAVMALSVHAWAVAGETQTRLIEEIIVTAQRVEESGQKVPIAVTAFTDAMIDDRQLVGVLDIQLFVPNVNSTATNFGPVEISIRGVGRLNEFQDISQDSVSFHVNQVPVRSPPLIEFYDLERLEALRGPQGTLFGRNSTAGAINTVTKRPAFEGFSGNVDADVGNYGRIRWRGAAEIPLSDRFALRLAGLKLDRDGYINNLAAGQLPNVDDDLDGRDLYSFRVTPAWRITDNTTLWVMYQRDGEDDDRVRISNQICKTNPLPTTACVPDEFGLEPVHPSASSFGIAAGLNGLIPLGARDATTGLNFDFPRPPLGLRDQHTDFEPVFELDGNLWIAGLEHSTGWAEFSVLGSRQKTTLLSLQDRYMDVGYTLNPTASNPSGLWPTSQPPTTDPGNPFSGPCDLLAGEGGIHGGCIVDADLTRFFTYDQVGSHTRVWTLEGKVATDFDGAFNGLLGAQYSDTDLDSDYYIPSNLFTSGSLYGDPAGGATFPLYMGFDANARRVDEESAAIFGEIYWTPAEAVKVSAGLRYTRDESRNRPMGIDFQSFDARGALGVAGDAPRWVRISQASWFLEPEPTQEALAITEYYGVTESARAAQSIEDLVSVLETIPPIAPFGEIAGAFGLSEKYKTKELTGRFVVDWFPRPETLVYASYSRGHNPGGIVAFIQEYDDEQVDAIEVGSKNLLFEDSLLLNVSAFFNRYDGLHFENRTATAVIIDNLDARVWGLELESRWRPSESIDVEFAYSWLNSKIDKFESLDLIDLTQGDPDLVLLRDIDGGRGSLYVASQAETLAIAPQAIADGKAFPAAGTTYDDGIPAIFSSGYLLENGVPVSAGVPVDLEGNKLPTSPEHSIHLGLAYTWFSAIGSLTARWDYYWQDDMYSRVFNRSGDRIESWDQHNASLTLTSSTGRWTARAWIRNIEDEDNVTDHYLHLSELAGPFRNYFLTEPRIYGATLRYMFGNN